MDHINILLIILEENKHVIVIQSIIHNLELS